MEYTHVSSALNMNWNVSSSKGGVNLSLSARGVLLLCLFLQFYINENLWYRNMPLGVILLLCSFSRIIIVSF